MGRLYSAADIENAAHEGRRELVVEEDAILSPLAADRARELGVQISRGRASGGEPLARAGGPTGARLPDDSPRNVEERVRRVLQEVIDEVGASDIREVVRLALVRLRPPGTASRAARPPRPDPARPLAGQVALVTGASSGIGQATAVELALAGAAVAVGTYAGDPHDVGATVAEVERVGGKCLTASADVRSAREIEDLCRRAATEWGRLDIAVANAAILRRDPIEQLEDEHWDAVLDVDLGGVMRTCRSAVGHMAGGGSIICVASIAGPVFGWAEHGHYAAAKAGILGLTRSLAAELGSRGIRVNAVLPGIVETPQSLDPATSVGPAGLRAAAARIPLQRVGDPEEIAWVVRFLASADAAYITGQGLIVDGGISTTLVV